MGLGSGDCITRECCMEPSDPHVLAMQRLQKRAERTAAAFQERLGGLALAMPQMCAALHLLDAGARLKSQRQRERERERERDMMS